MYFTPTSADEISEIKQAKSNGITVLSESFFTYAFAFILSILPVIAAWACLSLALFFTSYRLLFVVPAVISLFALSVRGFARFCKSFQMTKKRDFAIIGSSYTNKPISFSLKTLTSSVQIFFPSLLFCMVPLVFELGTSISLFCEIASVFLGIIGIAFFLSKNLFHTFDKKYIKFCSTFYLQIFLCIITSGFWLVFAVPYFILSAQNFCLYKGVSL